MKEKQHVRKLFVPVLRRVQGKKKKQKVGSLSSRRDHGEESSSKRSSLMIFPLVLVVMSHLFERVQLLLTRPVHVTMGRFCTPIIRYRMFLDLREERRYKMCREKVTEIMEV